MKLDVVIVTYRSAPAIESCLRSIPQEHRVIVVENASGDDTPRLAAALGAEVVENPENVGFAAAANQGAARGDHDAVLFLNPDAQLQPGAVEAMVQELADPDVAIVGAQLVHPDGRPQKSLWPYPSAGGLWAEALGVHRLRAQPGQFVVGACFLVRRSAFDALGGFDERFWLYGEEADLCYRAEQAGWKVVLADAARCVHEGGASGRESSELVAEHFARGSDRFVYVHHGRWALLSYRLATLVGASLRWPVLRLRNPTDPRVAARAGNIRRSVRSLLRRPLWVEHAIPRNPVEQVVVLSLEPWDEVWRRNQFLVRELLALRPSLRFLWVEPAQDVLHDVLRSRHVPRLASTRLRPLPGEPRVLRFRPRKWLPRSVWPFVDRSLVRQVRTAMARAGFNRSVLWVNDSTYAGLVRRSGLRSVYDITDDWLDADVPERERRRRQRREEQLIAGADEVVVCSPELQRRRGTTRSVHLIPNAVDVEHFRTPQPRPADLPTAPVAVYVGTLHEDRLDVELVEDLARELRDVSFVYVGPNALTRATNERLAAHPNVHLLGPRPYDHVPGYLQHADVVIVPHAVNAFTQSLDPIKAYECLAVGRPSLATAVSGFASLGDPVHLADANGFAVALRHLLECTADTVVVAVPSWAQRVASFYGLVSASDRSLE